MTNKRVLAATALALSVAVAFAPLATAQQQEPKLGISAIVANQQSITATTGPCETFSTVTSPGFREPITLVAVDGEPNRLQGYGWATAQAGTYTASVQCDGKTLTAQFTVLPREINWYLYPEEVEPGGTITAGGNAGTCRPAGPIDGSGPLTSPGFAAPLKFTRFGNQARFEGDTTVITTPGVYEVVYQCVDRPERSVKTFRILGTPPVTTPPGDPKPKPPIVKPKGAPQTGGGGTANRDRG